MFAASTVVQADTGLILIAFGDRRVSRLPALVKLRPDGQVLPL